MSLLGRQKRAADPVTGLALALPCGWKQVTPTAFDLVLVNDDRRRPADMFRPNVVATVVPVAAEIEIGRFVASTTRSWLEAFPSGHVVAVDLRSVEGVEGRRVLASFTEEDQAVTTVSFCFVSNGLGTRIDISAGVWDTADILVVAEEILDGFSAPTGFATPAALAAGDRVDASTWIRGMVGQHGND